MAKDAQATNPVSRAMSQYSDRNGKPNAHVVADQKAGAKTSSNKSSGSTTGKTGCGCS